KGGQAVRWGGVGASAVCACMCWSLWRSQPEASNSAGREVKGKWCPSLPDGISTGFGLTPPKPLPTFQSRVTESGDVEVLV
ncbi:hypothetical protein DUNSADRAFT_5395, partial [Dunaliella salina]